MTRRTQIERRLCALDEIKDIMGSMKTLALIETRKLTRYIGAQHRVVAGIEAAAVDFLRFHPILAPSDSRMPPAYLLIGSERGFCGDFNERVIEALATCTTEEGAAEPRLIVAGRKLQGKFEGDRSVIGRLEGPNAAEEVEGVLARLVDLINRVQREQGPLALTVLHHGHDAEGVRVRRLSPPFEGLQPAGPPPHHPPLLNLAPEEFLVALLDHYLFAALHEMIYTSLMVENRQRVRHLEGAVRRLEEKGADLALKRNMLRQEEITEEIEAILLHVESTGGARQRITGASGSQATGP